jgi:hypothetical protein
MRRCISGFLKGSLLDATHRTTLHNHFEFYDCLGFTESESDNLKVMTVPPYHLVRECMALYRYMEAMRVNYSGTFSVLHWLCSVCHADKVNSS